jgi:hypothetical protein
MAKELRDSYPDGQQLSQEPLVYLFDDYLSEDEISHVMQIATPQLQRALVSDGTGFPNLDLEVRARKGRMVIFHNCLTKTNIKHPNSLHGGLPVIKGEKWACNLWFRESPYQTSQKKNAAGYPIYGRIV